MRSDRLAAKCARGGAALAVGTVAERGARFIRNIILARLLAPDEFGIMAIVIASNQLFEAFTEVGVRQAIVQNKKGDTDAFLNVAWWFNAIRGLLLFLIGIAIAPWIALFYREASLTALLRVTFLGMIFVGLTSPKLYVLQKRLEFGRYVWIMQGSGFAGTVISLVCAIYLRNVWALVIGYVGEMAIRCVTSFLFCAIRPSLKVDRASLKELFTFARGMAGLPILTFIVMQADVFVLGRVRSKRLLGMYALALVLANMPQMLYSRIIQPMVLPVFAGFQDNKEKLQDAMLQTTSSVFLFGAPVITCLGIFSGPILSVAYGDPYVEVAGAFSLLLMYYFMYIIGTVIADVYMAIGKPQLHRRFTIIRAILVAIFIYPFSLWFGTVGAAATLLACMLLASGFQLVMLRQIIGLSAMEYIGSFKRGLMYSAVAAAFSIAFRHFWTGSQIVELLFAGAICGVAWIACFSTLKVKSGSVFSD